MIERGVMFGNIHSYYDLNLILAPFVPAPATPKTVYVDVDGADGSLDLTEAHGEVKYKNREHTFVFTVNPLDEKPFDEKVTQVANALNGKKCKITIDRDSDYYWEGRCVVEKYAQDRNLKQISIKATVNPYKMKQKETIVSIALTAEEKEVVLKNGRKSVVPEITCTDDNTVVKFGSFEKKLSAGTHTILDIYFKEGANTLIVSGSGTITIKYREGEL